MPKSILVRKNRMIHSIPSQSFYKNKYQEQRLVCIVNTITQANTITPVLLGHAVGVFQELDMCIFRLRLKCQIHIKYKWNACVCMNRTLNNEYSMNEVGAIGTHMLVLHLPEK